MKIIKEVTLAKNAKIAIIISRFNYFINQHLLNGALDILQRIGQVKNENITVIYVPGAFEIPIVTNIIANKKQYDAIITLGTIIKGSTTHFSLLSNEINTRISEISIQYKIPISFGVIVADNIEQAIERAGTKIGNKGSESALVILEMINVIHAINSN
ncbi:MAG: 6,7-dimethyl-8-ribityllumazine synthase [Buchnera aphidicola (Meitanaphis microgallis)]